MDLAVFGAVRKLPEQSAYAEGARVGDTIGDFRLDSRIASGGQGEVWEALQASLSRRVALKLVLSDRINGKTLALFAREARAGGRLAHPGIVAVHGYGFDDGRHWIAQELIEGGWTLRDFIDEMRNAEELPENYYRAVAVFVAELADALQAAHEAGVIHRDVKPQNVLVTPDDHPKLTDFGLARITDETAISMTGDFAGTWLYMSPEQVTARRIDLDHRTDIFSLGVVLYEVLALVRPFDGDTTHQIAENIVMRDPPDLRKIRSRVPRDMAVICAKALEKLKDARYPTMAEFAADLRRYLANEPVHAQPPTLLDRGVKWVRRNPTKSLVSLVALVAFLVISGLALHISRQKADLEEANSSLVIKTEEAHASATEAERKTMDVLRLSLAQDYEDLVVEAETLWPARPEKVEAMRSWLSAAEALVDELPALEAKRDDLRSRAVPRTEEQVRMERETHPEFAKLVSLQAELASKRAALAVRRGESTPELPSVDWGEYPTDAGGLNSLAWPMVDPEGELYGQAALGLVLAKRAVELAPDAEKARILDSVAWGCVAIGDDAGALDASRAALDAAAEDEQEAFAGYLSKVEAVVAELSSAEGLLSASALQSRLESDLAQLTTRLNERRSWTFPESEEQGVHARWWNNMLRGLIKNLQSLTTPGKGLLSLDGVSEANGWSVPRRLASAERLAVGFAPGGEFQVRWEEAASKIAAVYPSLDLPVQMGLVPIGSDPRSGLWEFWHVESGAEPLRDESGELEMEECSGLVLVLLPGGKFWMGAQSEDPDGQNYDEEAVDDESPAHEVELSAFFLSKYEMTQGQWKRLAGMNPSFFGPDGQYGTYLNAGRLEATLLEPVEHVSWFASVNLLDRVGLLLPSEAQWEYGCRGGTESVYWTGDSKEDLRGAVNLSDQYGKENGNARWGSWESWLEDGYSVHAPVNTLRPNAFGLHHVHGNVWEWCRDGHDTVFYGSSPSLNPVNVPTASSGCILRGGSFDSLALFARSATRLRYSPRAFYAMLGVRPAQDITTSSSRE